VRLDRLSTKEVSRVVKRYGLMFESGGLPMRVIRCTMLVNCFTFDFLA